MHKKLRKHLKETCVFLLNSLCILPKSECTKAIRQPVMKYIDLGLRLKFCGEYGDSV